MTFKHVGLHRKTGFHGKSTKGADGRGARMQTSVLDLGLGISRSGVNTGRHYRLHRRSGWYAQQALIPEMAQPAKLHLVLRSYYINESV